MTIDNEQKPSIESKPNLKFQNDILLLNREEKPHRI